MGGVDICPLLVLDFGQWNLSRSVSVLVLNWSSKKHPQRFHHSSGEPALCCGNFMCLWSCSFHPVTETRWQVGQIRVQLCLGTELQTQRGTGELGMTQMGQSWRSIVTEPLRGWDCLLRSIVSVKLTDTVLELGIFSNPPSGSETTIFSSCRILFLLIPLLIVWTVLSILCNKCKDESNLWAVSEARFILLFKRVSWNLPLFARWTASHHALVFSVSKCLC